MARRRRLIVSPTGRFVVYQPHSLCVQEFSTRPIRTRRLPKCVLVFASVVLVLIAFGFTGLTASSMAESGTQLPSGNLVAAGDTLPDLVLAANGKRKGDPRETLATGKLSSPTNRRTRGARRNVGVPKCGTMRMSAKLLLEIQRMSKPKQHVRRRKICRQLLKEKDRRQGIRC